MTNIGEIRETYNCIAALLTGQHHISYRVFFFFNLVTAG